MTTPTTPSPPPVAPAEQDRRASQRQRVSPFLTWFAVLGGVVAWVTHLMIAWAVMELSCVVRLPAYDLQHGGTTSRTEYTVAYGATVVPWLVAALALLSCLRLRARVRKLDDDDLAKGRFQLLVVLGIFLNALMLAAITGGGIGLYVLEPCQ